MPFGGPEDLGAELGSALARAGRWVCLSNSLSLMSLAGLGEPSLTWSGANYAPIVSSVILVTENLAPDFPVVVHRLEIRELRQLIVHWAWAWRVWGLRG